MSRSIKIMCSRVAIVMAIFLSAVVPMFGQASGTAAVNGTIEDSTKSAITSASVKLLNQATGTETDVRTNGSGGFSLPSIAPGTYTLQIEHDGFAVTQIRDLLLNVGDNKNLIIQLKIQNNNEKVVVEANDSMTINTTDATVSTVVDQNFVANIPLNGRSFQSLLTSVPGVTAVPSQGAGFGGEVTVNGQRTEANYFTVDGVSANVGGQAIPPGYGGGLSGSVANETVAGTTQSIIPLDALEEFRALTSTFSAEYGRTPGGSFLFISRSGTNKFHGNVYDYVRNGIFDANNTFNNMSGIPRQAESQNDYGGFFGGPVILPHLYNGTNKTFFFFAMENLNLNVPHAATKFDVPTLAVRAAVPTGLQPFINAYPLPNGADEAGNGLNLSTYSWSLPSTQQNYSLRLDQAIGDRTKLFLRIGRSTSYAQSRATGIVSVLSPSSESSDTATIGATTVVTNSLVNALRFNMTGTHFIKAFYFDGFGGSTPLGIPQIAGLGPLSWLDIGTTSSLADTAFISPSSNRARQLNVVDTVTKSWGHHNATFGIDYRQLNNSAPLPDVYEIAQFTNGNSYVTDTPNVAGTTAFPWVYKQSQTSEKPVYKNISSFAQDEWKLGEKFSVSAGVRWEINPAPTDAAGLGPYTLNQITDLTTATLLPRGSSLWSTRYDNFAPRLGFAYRVHTLPGRETVIRAGAGIFYDTGNDLASKGYMYAAGISVLDKSTPGTPFPLSAQQIQALPSNTLAVPYSGQVSAFDPHLKSPYAEEYNLAIEQALGSRSSLTVGYVGSVGRSLISGLYAIPKTGEFTINGAFRFQNDGSSNYNSLQVKLEQRLGNSFQMLTSYTWSRSIDNISSNFSQYALYRANSDFDIRNNFQTSLTYDAPSSFESALARSVLGHWSFDARISARSSLPVNIISSTAYSASGQIDQFRPNIVAGQPLYVYGNAYPGGRAINFAAFSAPAAGVQGNTPRNFLQSFDAVQADTAVRRDFPIKHGVGILIRVEAFNLLNHPIYGALYNTLTNGAALFGRASNTENTQLGALSPIYQVGGPRSLQFAAKLHF